MDRATDLTGREFGRWVVVEKIGFRNRRTWWFCKCQCGTQRAVRSGNLTSGKSLSCGCLQRELASQKFTTHGLGGSSALAAIKSAISRYTKKNYQGWEHYGGRGIKVCERWMNDPTLFVADMGEPAPGMSIERVDVNGDYEPSNCTWADVKTQSRNRTSNRIIEYNGEKKCLAEWSELIGIKQTTIDERMKRGWTVKEAFETPVGSPRRRL